MRGWHRSVTRSRISATCRSIRPKPRRRAIRARNIFRRLRLPARASGSRLSDALAKGSTPLVLGGDHSIAVGTVGGVSRFFRMRGEKVGLIWIDAHADMNTPESSPSGNVHGMPLACLRRHRSARN